MKEKISCLGTEKVAKMNSPARMCQPVSASDNKNPPLDNERERNKMRKIKLAREGKNIFCLYFRILNKDKGSSFPRFRTPWITQDVFEPRKNFIPLQKMEVPSPPSHIIPEMEDFR